MDDPQITRAVAQLDQFTNVYPQLMRSLQARVEYAHQMARDVGVTPEQWRAMTFEEREQALRKWSREVVPKIMRHFRLRSSAWRALTWEAREDLTDRWREEVRDEVIGAS